MASDGNGGNNVDPLLQYLIRPRNNPQPSLSEHGDVEILMPMTPSELKDRLIFGALPRSVLVDTLSQNPSSPSSFPDSSTIPTPSSSRRVFRRSGSAPVMAAINDLTQPIYVKPEQSIVRQVVALFIVYLSLGVFFYWLNRDNYLVNQTHPVVDALYFCIVTICTIGYGDITPDSIVTKLFSVLFVLVGFGFLNILLSGMVSYVLDFQKKPYIIDVEKGRMRIRLKVGLALGLVVLCLVFGVLIMHFVEKIGWLDSFYFSVMSVTTVGYGDGAFKTLPGRLLASIWLLVSTLAVAQVFLYLAVARVDKRNRDLAKKVLDETMSISEFFAADIDNNGSLSRSDYVIHKLKMMGKITDMDIILITKQFEKVDRTNSGKITLFDLSTATLQHD